MSLAMKQSVVRAPQALASSRLAPRAVPAVSSRRSVIRHYKEKDTQAQSEVQGSNAPKNPITGQPLETVKNPQKEGYQAVEFTPQGDNARSRIDQQLGPQPGGRDAFGESIWQDGSCIWLAFAFAACGGGPCSIRSAT